MPGLRSRAYKAEHRTLGLKQKGNVNMFVHTNVPALNAHRKLKDNQSKLNKNLEKLASGYRINRAGDDAAGLAISEKMRGLIAGMERAELNSEEGIDLIRTGEGSMQEVHAMLDRVKTMAVQAANGIYNDETDRASLQKELDFICQEVDRIAKTSNFNGIALFQDEGLHKEGITYALTEAEAHALSLHDVISDSSDKLKNIVYTETVFDFETTQSPAGDSNGFTGEYATIANTLQTSIVPQIVSAITEKYTAFNYLTGSSIGIGLNLYSEAGSSVLASVTVGTGYTTIDGKNETDFLTYKLSVNVAAVGDLSVEANRNALEQTIAHEMIHAFMDEATTVGMTGISPDSASDANKFPSWFVEGMAQTASGPGNWTRGASLGLTASSTAAEIQAALSGSSTKLGSGTSASEYGTGYLACMYLGYLAAGADADMTDSTAAAADITQGVSTILSKLINGASLKDVINEVTGYSTIGEFENYFASNLQAQAFVQKLLQYTSTEAADGNVGGGLLSGDLAATNPVVDNTVSGLKLFALDTGNTAIKNEYPSDITVLSGGGATINGVAPITPDVPITYPSGVFTVSGGTEGTDWKFDTSTGILSILSDKSMTISGGTLSDATGDYYGNIVIADGIDANLTLSGLNIDASKKSGNTAGIEIGNGCNVNLKITGDNVIKGGGEAAAIQLTGNYIHGKDAATQAAEHDLIEDSSLIIDTAAGSTLTATGGTSGSKGGAGIGAYWATDTSKSDITITGSGTVNAYGGNGGAGIGGSEGGDIGNIVINGNDADTSADLTIKAEGGSHGAGIGGGGWVSNYPNGPQHVESIVITGDVDINASSKFHGTGIGSGCHGSVGTIIIGTDNDNPEDDKNIKIVTNGGDDGAAIGAGWDGTMDSIVINGGDITAIAGQRGAGIGSGYQGDSGEIVINGGTITAKGSTNSSGIGGGMKGTITGITINGGTITADGGWTNDGGNIGGYTDSSGKNKATVTITSPEGLTIKAGESGEGKYITTGAVDADGNTLYALDISYIDELLKNGSITLTADGADASSLSYRIDTISVTTAGGITYDWNDLQHGTENSAYIWMKGEDITLTFKDADGTEGSVDLKFFADYGMWRKSATDLPDEVPKEPGYVVNNNGGGGALVTGDGAIFLHVGPTEDDTFGIPRFYFSKTALGMNTLDISTQESARKSIDKVDAMIDRVSEIRSTYGALSNALDHIINNLNTGVANMTDAESRIRDVDMAKEMMAYTKNNILIQASQSMLAQANMVPQGILSLLQ